MEALETIEVPGAVAKIYPDMEPMSPREWDNLGTFYVPGEIEEGTRPTTCRSSYDDDSWRFAKRYIELFQGGVAIPVRYSDYGSSGARIHETDAENANGIYYCLPERMETLGVEHANARKGLLGELEEFDQWLQGDVYGYVVETLTGEHLHSCWGFIGIEWAIQEAQSVAEYAGRTELENRRWAEGQGIPTTT